MIFPKIEKNFVLVFIKLNVIIGKNYFDGLLYAISCWQNNIAKKKFMLYNKGRGLKSIGVKTSMDFLFLNFLSQGTGWKL